LIAGYNDGVEHITRIAELAGDLEIEKISFLPYHEGGVVKVQQIGQENPEFSAQAPTEGHLRRLLGIITQKNITATIRS
jgi:pyruvate formate lyase activating enzyme